MSRYHHVSETLTDRYVLTVRAGDGSIVRRREYRSCDDKVLLGTLPTTEELIAGYRGEVWCQGSLCWSFEPVNPKVLPLVESLREAGVVTTGSGDMYGDDLVYVDLADEWEDAVGSAKLPPGWIVTPRLADVAREALGLPPQELLKSGEPVEGVQGDPGDMPGPSTRLSRKGLDVAPEEVEAIKAALLLAARPRYFRASRAVAPELRLECRCADDRGAGYKDESERTDDDTLCIEDYEETRAAQLAMAREAEARGIAHFVSDSDDRDSRHSDAYVYFPLSRLEEVAGMLATAGLAGDILDVPSDFPRREAERVEREHGWAVEFE